MGERDGKDGKDGEDDEGPARQAETITVATTIACDEPWTGFVHPQRTNLLAAVEIGAFESLEECRTAAREALARAGWTEGAYACGQGCRERAGFSGSFMCERTEI